MYKKKKVLIVDDDDSIRKMIKLALIRHYEVVEAASATAALNVLKANPVDGVISDYHMPKMNGLEFVRALRLDRRWHCLPVIMVSSLRTKDHLLAATAAGVSKFFSKPFELKELQSAVDKLLVEAV